MNPGVFVMGGGAVAGGSGGRNGRGAGAGQGAGPNNGGNGAGGGGKGAGSCGQGSGAGCPNPSHGNGGGTAAGDPVDIVTGRVYTIPAVDLTLAGCIPLVLHRMYSTACSERDVGLGFGWSHSFAWEIDVGRRALTVWKPEGTFIRAAIPAIGEQVAVEEGVFLSRQEWGYTLATEDGLVLVFHGAQAVHKRIPLTRVLDRAGNAIELSYQGGALRTITDSVGRTIRVRRHADGHIAAFEVKNGETQAQWVAFKQYEYDKNGDLVAVVDPYGHRTRFTYDDHRMSSRTYPSGLRVTFRYDAQWRCVETWAEHPGGTDPSLADDVPKKLADGTTPAKGVLHCKLTYGVDGFTEVVDSRQVRRYDGNGFGKVERASWCSGVHTCEYDERGNMTAYTDALGAQWAWKRNSDGRVVEKIDPLGAVTRYEYDQAGQCTAEIDPLGYAVRYAYDACGRLARAEDDLGLLVSFSYDNRGQLVDALLPHGGVTRFVLDRYANRVEVHEPNGALRRIRYDYFGRVVAMLDERGGETRYAYDDRGSLTLIRLPNGGLHRFDYDADGRLVRITNADGYACELRWGGFHAVHELRRHDGRSVQFRYDREGDLVQVINEAGEIHRIVRDIGGRVVAEQTFDGRRLHYRTDANGRIILVENGLGEKTELDYDLAGRLVKRTYMDGSEDRFEYDAVGRVVYAQNEVAECTIHYDDRGRKVGERVRADGAMYGIHSGFDALGLRTSMRTSLGHAVGITRDVMGSPTQVMLGGEALIRFRGDAFGNEMERILPGGGVVRYERDIMGRCSRRCILRPGQLRAVRPGEPAWVGAQPAVVTSDRAYTYSAAGALLATVDAGGGRVDYQYDAAGQILARVAEHLRAELFRYDRAGDLHEAGSDARRYGPGGKLLTAGDTEYAYDGDARLVEKRVRHPDGSLKVWKYHWSARGLLESVAMPDGGKVRFTYDPFGRRVCKEHVDAQGNRISTRFVWDSDVLVHELRQGSSAGAAPVIEERTYVFQPGSYAPLAHRDARVHGEIREFGGWIYYINDQVERPELLLSGAGDVVAALQPTVWGGTEPSVGARADTPLRYPGQYADAETGLSYNRFRYYDPVTGRYISPDPLGLEGGLKAFAYAENAPFTLIDPLGLVFATISGDGPPITAGSNTTYPEGSRERSNPDIHDIVRQSMAPNMATPPDRLYPAGNRPPGTCAEPRALSQYIRRWEDQHNGGRRLDPNDPNDHAKIRQCLGSISSIRSRDENGPRRPCPNCSQLLANLNHRWGVPATDNNSIVPGAGGPDDPPRRTNWSRPDQAWLQAAQANPTPSFTPMVGYGQPAR